jgi:radical SAM superfamily enzyme YgiQ (UPF0313 family)
MFPLDYIEPIFRPPSEARSLILQVTNGCSYNKCTFCTMYTEAQKRFKVKPASEIETELVQMQLYSGYIRRIFLADGDAMTLSFRRLDEILDLINRHFPDINRVSAYCLPRNLNNKTVEQLIELRQKGLSLVYVGAESGDDLVLKKVAKGETYASTLVALSKLKQAGIKTSVMVLNGLGGKRYSEQHAINSARLVSEAQPEYLSTLVLTMRDQQRFLEGFDNDYEPMSQLELIQEMQLFIQNCELENSLFRSDHASNHLVLKGVLGKDKEAMLHRIELALRRL